MLLGNAALSLIALGIAQRGPERTWLTDAAFWIVAASLVLDRYLDIARLGGTTASGEPSSFRAWRQYSWRLLLLALAVWIVAHALRRAGGARVAGQKSANSETYQQRSESRRIPVISAAPTVRGAPLRSRGCFSVPSSSAGISRSP